MKKRVWLLILFQICLLLTIVGKYQYIAATGETITLKTAPIDPRDLFYGDYVILNYDIAELDIGKVPHDVSSADEGRTVYVMLEKKENPWHEAVGVYRNAPEQKPGQVLLKGRLRYYGESDYRVMNIDYGLDRYYVPENTGRDIEDRREELNRVDIIVTESGDAIIKELRFD